MKELLHDVLPVMDGRWILRAVSNGRVIFRNNEGETHGEFFARCSRWCDERSTLDRPSRLRVYRKEEW